MVARSGVHASPDVDPTLTLGRPAERAFVQSVLESPRTADKYERLSNHAAADPILNRRQRIVALDLLRGYFLFVMIVDHLGRFPSLFDLFTGRGAMWVSAAEGFFFISGIVVTIARNREAEVRGMRSSALSTWRKAGTLYLWAVGLTLFSTYVVFAFGKGGAVKAGLIAREPFGAILYQAATLKYAYGWTDFLQSYAIFLLAAPLVLWLLRRGWWWATAAASVSIWLSSYRFESRWQVLFFGGMICGFYLHAVERWFRDMDRTLQKVLVSALFGLAGTTMLLSATIVYVQPHFATVGWKTAVMLGRLNDRLAPHFDKWLLPLPRVLMFGLWFAALYVVFRRCQTQIKRYLGWFLLPLGLNSLLAYIVHGLVVLAVALTLRPVTGLVANFAITAGALLLIWGVTARTDTRKIRWR